VPAARVRARAALSADLAPVAALTALAAVLRFSTLDVQSLWVDEGFTAQIVRQPLGQLLDYVRTTESTPPLYYAAAWVWAKVFGTGEAGLRSLSALCGTMLVALMYVLGRRLASRRVGLIGAALVAVSPFMVWYSQEARAYALLALLCTLAFAWFVRALEVPRARVLAGWGVVSALAVATHYFAVFPLAAQGIWLLWRCPRRRMVLAAGALPVLTLLALSPLLLYQRDHVPRPWTGASTALDQVLATGQAFLVGIEWNWLIHRPGVAALAALGVLAVVLLVRRGDDAERRTGRLAAGVAGAAVTAPLLASLVATNYLAPRNVIYAWPLLALALAAGLGARRAGRLGVAAAGLLCALSAAIVVAGPLDDRLQRDDWRATTRAAVGAGGSPVLVVTPRFIAAPVVEYYAGESAPLRAPVVADRIAVIGHAEAAPGLFSALPVAGFLPDGRGRAQRLAYSRYRGPPRTLVDPRAFAGYDGDVLGRRRDEPASRPARLPGP